MSALARTCLRLAACAALRDVTPAGGNVFDSFIGTDCIVEGKIVPTISVYTEEDEGDALSSQNGGPPFEQVVELVLEITMVAGLFDSTGFKDIAYPETDGELEATIDTVETIARAALTESYAPAAVSFRRIAKRFRHSSSVRFTEPNSTTRIAKRYVAWKIEVDDIEIFDFDASRQGLDRLPEPFASIAKTWPDGHEKDVALAISDQLAQPTVPLLAGMNLNPPSDPPADQPATEWSPSTSSPPSPPNGPVVEATWDFGA